MNTEDYAEKVLKHLVQKARSAKEVKEEIRRLKDEMKRNGIPITSFMNRQTSPEAARANERLFALNQELENAVSAASPDKIRQFVATQNVDPENLKFSSVLDALAERFNRANRANVSGADVRAAIN